MTKRKHPFAKPPRPKLTRDAADILDVGPAHGRALAAQGLFGKLRSPTPAERYWYRLPVNARIVVDMGVVQRLRQKREKAAAVAAVKSARRKRAK